jgi:hypothetical protein
VSGVGSLRSLMAGSWLFALDRAAHKTPVATVL